MQPAIMLSHILDLHDARYCAAVGVTLLGFRMNGAEGDLNPAEVSEILEWLSGPVGVAEFGIDALPHEVNERIAASKCEMALLPSGCDPRLISSIDCPVIIRLEPQDPHMSEWGKNLDSDNFLLLPAGVDPQVVETLRKDGIPFDRLILTVESLQEVSGLLGRFGELPYAISLGGFVKDADGSIDYNRCDDFLESFQAHLPV